MAQVRYARGFDSRGKGNEEELLQEAAALAKESDLCVLFLGLPEADESEGFDRAHLRLPDSQLRLADQVCARCGQVAVVLHAGAPVTLPFLHKVQALLLAYLGGETVGGAAVDVLFGAVSPSGKLAETWPQRLEDTPAYLNFPGDGTSVRYDEGVYVGYRWYDKRDIAPLFPFGFGLSYTSFAYNGLTLSQDSLPQGGELTVEVSVTNTGDMRGKESLQLYIAPENQPLRPVKELKGFEKLSLEPGETKTARFTLTSRDFAYWEERLPGWYAPGGRYQVLVGASSRDIRLSASVTLEAPEPLPLTIDMNTPIGELLARPRCARVLMPLVAQAQAMMSPPSEGEGIMPAEALAGMMRDLPLRGVALFAGGMLPEGFLDGLIAQLRALG